MIEREIKRKHIRGRDAGKRVLLKKQVIDESLSDEQRWEAMLKLQKLPRNGSAVRQRNRCFLTGRPRGYYRKFGLSRNKLRELIMKGDVPGVIKSSW